MKIAANLRQLRLSKGMTQDRVANEIGLTRQAVSSYESGRTRPDIDTLMRLSEIYGVSVEDILYGHSSELKGSRAVKTVAIVLYALVSLHILLQNVFLWAAFRFFPLTNGPVEMDDMATAHFRLTSACVTTERITLVVSLISFVMLLIIIASIKTSISWKSKTLYVGVFSATILIIPVVFGSMDPVSTVKDHILVSYIVLARLLLAFIVSLLIGWIQKRKAYDTDK